jgi:hypothetical protein
VTSSGGGACPSHAGPRSLSEVRRHLPERGAALFEQLGANAQRGARGPVAKPPAAEVGEHRYELDRGSTVSASGCKTQAEGARC